MNINILFNIFRHWWPLNMGYFSTNMMYSLTDTFWTLIHSDRHKIVFISAAGGLKSNRGVSGSKGSLKFNQTWWCSEVHCIAMSYYDSNSNSSKGRLEPFDNLGELPKHFVSAPVGQIGQIVPLFNLEFT